jgi:hypothetical protein
MDKAYEDNFFKEKGLLLENKLATVLANKIKPAKTNKQVNGTGIIDPNKSI